jgi:Ser/Thr protein kinase RdoA (MazF antagonist)
MENKFVQILKEYDINANKLKGRRGGFNKNWIVYTDNGKYFLKRRLLSRKEKALADCEISNHLLRKGMITSKPLKAKDGNYLIHDNGYVYSLFDYVRGGFYKDKALPFVAKAMSDFHEKTKDYKGEVGMRMNAIDWTYSMMKGFENYEKYITKAENDFKGADLSKSLIHFDLHAGNMKFRGRKAIPFDFEYAHSDYKLLDVANSLICLTALNPYELDYGNAETFIKPCKLDFQKSKTFISEFNKLSNIEEEIETLPSHLNLAWISWALYTFKTMDCSERTIKNAEYLPKWIEENREKIVRVHKDVLH